MRNVGQPIGNQIKGAFDHLSKIVSSIGLTLETIVKFDDLFINIWNIPIMEKVINKKIERKYPARRSIQTEFAGNGIPFKLMQLLI